MKKTSQFFFVLFCTFLFFLINIQGIIAQKIDWSDPYEMSSVFNTNEIIQASSDLVLISHRYKDENYYFRRENRHL